MNLSAIYHRTNDNFSYAIDRDTLQINIKTGYDITNVNIICGDPFTGGILGGKHKWIGDKIAIDKVIYLEHHILWSINIRPKYKRLKYYFEIFCNEEKMLFYEDGFFKEEDMGNKSSEQYFIKPWLNIADINTVPKWVNDTVWYQIFPDRFCNGDNAINCKETIAWASQKPINEHIYGGDLRGIINKLDYIEKLGANGIYLTPIFKALSTHKYDTINYFEIDEQFGDKKVFKELVDKAHKKGIKIMLDGVFNHCGKFFDKWQDVLQNGEESEYLDWFMVNRFPIDKNQEETYNKDFYSFAFTANMPKLNTNNQEVVNYILSICEYWVKEFDIDGWRIDVANEVSHHLCKKIRERVKSIKPEIYLLGEIWHDSISWLNGDEYDAVMNYPLTTAINDFWSDKSITKVQFEYKINRCYNMYMEQTNSVLFNLLDSHDTDRLINRVQKNQDIFIQQMSILFSSGGTPSIFYGTEIFLEGEHDPDCRACMPWDKINEGAYNNRINIIKKLINIRKDYEPLRGNGIQFINTINNKRVIEYIKYDKDTKIKVVINGSDENIRVNSDNIIFSNLLDGNILKKNGTLIQIIDSLSTNIDSKI